MRVRGESDESRRSDKGANSWEVASGWRILGVGRKEKREEVREEKPEGRANMEKRESKNEWSLSWTSQKTACYTRGFGTQELDEKSGVRT